jgi:hypothetical protein
MVSASAKIYNKKSKSKQKGIEFNLDAEQFYHNN